MLPLLTGYFRVIRAREVEVENYTQRGLMHLNATKPTDYFVKLHL